MIDKSNNVIVLWLKDKVLMDVVDEVITSEMWLKLESLYMTKSLAYRQLLKQLKSYRMVRSSQRNLTRCLITWIILRWTWMMKIRICFYYVLYQSVFRILRMSSFMERKEPLLLRRSKQLCEHGVKKCQGFDEKSGEGLNISRGMCEHRGKVNEKSRSKYRFKGCDKLKYKMFYLS